MPEISRNAFRIALVTKQMRRTVSNDNTYNCMQFVCACVRSHQQRNFGYVRRDAHHTEWKICLDILSEAFVFFSLLRYALDCAECT